MISLVVVALLAGAVTALARWADRETIGRGEVGDCLRLAEGDADRYRLLDCRDPAAAFILLATQPTARECIDVPGTSRIFTANENSYCIGEKGVDVNTAINGIKAGECLVLEGDQPRKAPCRQGSFPVLLVLQDVQKTQDTDDLAARCVEGGAEKVAQTYAWGISIVQSKTVGTWDRLLCLGSPVRR